MKKYTITGAEEVRDGTLHDGSALIEGDDCMQVSDGYHTMDELYDHRITLFIALCRSIKEMSWICRDGECTCEEKKIPEVWRSKNHSDGEPAFGGTWFVLGINKDAGEQITYHIPIERWEETSFAETLETAPEWDKHTSADVLKRLKEI